MAHFKSLNSFQNITNHTISIFFILNTNNDKAIRIQLIFLPCHCITQIIYGVTAIAPLVNNAVFNAVCNTTSPLMKSKQQKKIQMKHTFRLAWIERKRETLGASRHAVFFFFPLLSCVSTGFPSGSDIYCCFPAKWLPAPQANVEVCCVEFGPFPGTQYCSREQRVKVQYRFCAFVFFFYLYEQEFNETKTGPTLSIHL